MAGEAAQATGKEKTVWTVNSESSPCYFVERYYSMNHIQYDAS